MTTNVKSLSEQLFELILKDYPIGIQLTSGDLKVTANTHGIVCSEGAVAGFMNRAVRKEVLKLVGAVIPDLRKNKKAFVYQVLSHEPWDFKAPSKGSLKGRELKSYNMQDVPLIEYSGTHNGEPIKVIEAKDKDKVQFGIDKAVKDWADKCVTNGTVEDEIMLRLAEVMALIEAQRGVRTNIAAFSDDEIADEVKRRFHSK